MTRSNNEGKARFGRYTLTWPAYTVSGVSGIPCMVSLIFGGVAMSLPQ